MNITVEQWEVFKQIVITNKGLAVHFVEAEKEYQVFAGDHGIFVWRTIIPKDGGEIQTDFDENFKNTANGPMNSEGKAV